MRISRSFLLILIINLLLLSSCGFLAQGDPASQAGYMPQDSPALSDSPSGDGSSSDPAQWPDFIPDEIPELEGDIQTVFISPELRVRIFYENVTDSQIESYLDLLESEGFDLTYLVYQQEGFPDNSEERLAKGDYDAVDITKGDYHMNLSSGDGTAVYDIYTDGFEDLAAQALEVTWPADLAEKLSAPEGCALTDVSGSLESKYVIQCSCDGSEVLLNYADQLRAQNFTITDESITVEGDTVARKLQKDTLIVTLTGLCNPSLTVEVESSDLVQWSAVFPSELPQPTDCTLSDIRTAGPNTTYVDCIAEKEGVITNYAAELVNIGFNEMARKIDQNEAVTMIVLTRDQDMITLSFESPDLINIVIYLSD